LHLVLRLRGGVNQIATKADFDKTLADAPGLVVVDFTATWCPPCKRIAPIFAAMAEAEPSVTFIKVDVDENAETAQAVGINCMPTFKFYKKGECVHTMEGADEAGLKAKVAELK